MKKLNWKLLLMCELLLLTTLFLITGCGETILHIGDYEGCVGVGDNQVIYAKTLPKGIKEQNITLKPYLEIDHMGIAPFCGEHPMVGNCTVDHYEIMVLPEFTGTLCWD